MAFALIKEILRRLNSQAAEDELVSFELFHDGSWKFNYTLAAFNYTLAGVVSEDDNKFNSNEYASFSDLMDDLREKI
jgi:hypothetical protein